MSVRPSTPYLAQLCWPVVHLTGCRHLWLAASDKLDVQWTSTAVGRMNFAVSGPETWNSLPAELRLSTLSTATFARLLKAHLFVSTEWHVSAARLILLNAVLLLNIITIIIINAAAEVAVVKLNSTHASMILHMFSVFWHIRTCIGWADWLRWVTHMSAFSISSLTQDGHTEQCKSRFKFWQNYPTLGEWHQMFMKKTGKPVGREWFVTTVTDVYSNKHTAHCVTFSSHLLTKYATNVYK